MTIGEVFDKDACDENLVSNKSILSRLQTKGFVHSKMENYRRINLDDILPMSLPDGSRENCQIDYSEWDNQEFYKVVFLNDKLCKELCVLPEGIEIDESTNADTLVGEDCSPLGLLNEALSQSQYKMSISQSLDKPIMIINLLSTQAHEAYFSKLCISLEAGCSAQIVDLFVTNNNEPSYSNVSRHLSVNKDSNIGYIKCNKLSDTQTLNLSYFANIEGGNLCAHAIEGGSKQTVNEWQVDLNCAQSKFELNGLMALKNHVQVSNIIEVDHHASNTYSDQFFSHLLGDNSRAIFNSKILVGEKHAHVEAHQHSKSILLSDNARVFNEPKMMIFTDDLEASHGASVGSLDEDSLNYLRLRGLTYDEASLMLQEGFKNEIYNRITDDKVREYILRLFK